MEKKQIVNKNFSLINARYRLSTVQSKMVLKVISLINNKIDTEFETYQLSLDTFDFLTDNENYTRLKTECENLMSRVLKIQTDDGWLVANWFSSIEYKNSKGVVECSIDPKLKPYLLEIKKNFKYYELYYIMKMGSEYSIRIYEMLKQYELIGKRKFELTELHEILQTPITFKKRYPNFRVDVLEVAVKEINKYSDITISFEPIKRSRAVFWIEFTITKNEKNIIECEAFESVIEYDEIKHKEFKILFKKFGFEDKLFDGEFRSFCLFNNDKEEKITIDNFKKWCMQKKRKRVKELEKSQEQQEKSDYKWNFKKAKHISDKLKDWLEFDLGLDWKEKYYWKDIYEFEIKARNGILKIGWKKMPHPDFNKDEILLFKIDDESEDSQYLVS